MSSKDAVLWSKADLLFTDALLQLVHHVKLGRLQKDSITLRQDSVLSKQFFAAQINKFFTGISISSVLDSLEPHIPGYHQLKAGIQGFLSSADFRNHTYIPFPTNDTAKFKGALKQRLIEDSLIDPRDPTADSLKISAALKKYQKLKKLTIDGKAGQETIRSLNTTDKERFSRIALTLDKFKMLPDSMPKKYIWVNLPAYYLELRDSDTLKIVSKIVVGKPITRTPELNSAISDMITYPQWNIPESIIEKEILPGLKKDPGYLAEKGYGLVDSKNEEVDPYFVDWSKYKKTIPYKVVQGSGDDNALGILKFNFPNKYAVYLHDTNQRYLFANKNRSLSHGCVRVQEWQKLSTFILNNDSTYVVSKGKTTYTKTDSVTVWLSNKEKHYIPVRDRIPLFIRYFTCEAKDGKIVFYDDVYSEDQRLKEKYFQSK
jgi:murein L,D-transpeptidase YcbB/YkuD